MSGTEGTPEKKRGKTPDISKLANARPTRIPRAMRIDVAPVSELDLKEKIRWRKFWICIGVLFFGAVSAHIAALWGSMVFNDLDHFRAVAQSQSDDRFWNALWSQSMLQPLSQAWVKATYAWDLNSFPWNAAWSHAVNITLHFTACLYLFLFLFRLARYFIEQKRINADPYILALSASLLFAVHPLTCGAVTYISGRSGPLLALNYFLGLNFLLFGLWSENIYFAFTGYLVSLVLMAIGLLCSAQAMTFPVIAILVAWLIKGPNQTWKQWGRLWDLSLYALAALGAPFLILLGIPRLLDNGAGLNLLSPVAYIATQFKALLTYYLRGFLIPIGLSVDPPYSTASGFSDVLSLLGVGVVIGTIFALYRYRQQPLVLLGLTLFLCGLLPNTFLVQYELVADHRFYLSLAGLCIVAGSLFGRQAESNFKKTALILLIVSGALVGLTVWRVFDWGSNEALWQRSVALNPSGARAHAKRAEALLAANKSSEALAEADKSISLDPTLALGYATIGKTKELAQDYSAAVQNFTKALDLAAQQEFSSEQIALLQKELAICYDFMGQQDKAKQVALDGLRLLPEDPELSVIVGNAFLAEKKPGLAYRYLFMSFQKNRSDPNFLLPLAEACLDSGIPRGSFLALQLTRRAQSMQVGDAQKGNLLLARAAVNIGELDQAELAIKALLEKPNTKASGLYLMSAVRARRGDASAAEKLKQEALVIDPKIAEKLPLFNDSLNPPDDKRGTPATNDKSPPTPPPAPDKQAGPQTPSQSDAKGPDSSVSKEQ